MRANAGSFCIVSTTTFVSGDASAIFGIASSPEPAGHVQVEDEDGRLVAEGVAHGGLGVARLGDDLDVGLGLEHHPDPLADDLVVVGEDDRDLPAACLTLSRPRAALLPRSHRPIITAGPAAAGIR